MSDAKRMGLTKIDAVVSGSSGESIRLELLVDSGAQYTLLPREVWMRLGLRPERRMRFHLADLTTMERGISDCYIELDVDGERLTGPTPVILGEESDVALLGVVTLESLGLILNPLERSIHKATVMPLMSASA
jgi:predicted aspartyl protease